MTETVRTASAQMFSIDIGKTNAKCTLIDVNGSIVARRSVPSRSCATLVYPTIPIDEMLDDLREATRDLDLSKVGRMVAVTHGAAFACLGPDGLVLPVMDYEFEPDPAFAAEYDAIRPLQSETLSPNLAQMLNAGRQLFWLERYHADAFRNTRAIVPLAQYIGWRLGAPSVSEINSLGCHTDLWDPVAQDYSTLVEARGWRALFAPLRRAGTDLGRIDVGVADEWRLPRDCHILNGLHDSNVDLLPYLDRTDVTVLSTGTWFVAMALCGGVEHAARRSNCGVTVAIDGRIVPTVRFLGGRAFEHGTDPAKIAVEAKHHISALPKTARIEVVGPASANAQFVEALARSFPDRKVVASKQSTSPIANLEAAFG